MDNTPHWKRIWVTITGRCRRVTANNIYDALELSKDYLLQGITMYKPYTEESFKLYIEKIGGSSNNPEFRPFIRRMSMALNLDVGIAWAVFNNYLMFECYKKLDGIEHVLTYQTSQMEFIINIWQFYTLERTYLIRTINYILENHQSVLQPFYKEYDKFITNVTHKRFQQSLFKQLLQLIKEIRYSTAKNCIELRQWIERNNGEQLQILLTILTSIAYEPFEISEFIQIFQILKEHNFTHTPVHMDVLTLSRPTLLKSVKNAEFAVFIAGFSNFWKNPNLWQLCMNEINRMLREVSTSGDISPLLLAWVVLHTTLPENKITDEYNDELQGYLNIALERNVFFELRSILGDPVFANSVSGITMKGNIYSVIEYLCYKFGGDLVCEYEGVIELLGELLQTDHLAKKWANEPNQAMRLFYLDSISMFPYLFEPLSVFAEALINLEDGAENMVMQLCNLKAYTEVGTDQCEKPRKQVLYHTYKPFDNDFVIFHPGTEATISKKLGQTVTVFHGKYSYFRVLLHMMNKFFDQIEQHNYDKSLEKKVLTGYKVLLVILKTGYHLIKDNADVKELMRLSHCMLFTTTKSGTKNLNLMKFFFKFLITELPHNSREVVEHLMDMKFLPQLAKPEFTGEDFFNTGLLTHSSLLQFIQEELSECSSCDLLLLYVKLVKVCMNMGKYHFEIQIPGLMFLILKVFPMIVNEFYTDNIKDREVAIKLVKIVYVILNKGRDIHSEVEILIFDCIIELFLNQSWYIKSLIKVFEIGNTKLELFLTTEMNWEKGPILKVVKVIKRALSCIMIVLNFISSHSKIEKHQFLEEYLYLNYDVSNLKCIAGYVNHTFNPVIAKISCSILSNFALVSKKPILQSLELDDYQVQRMFLDRLRDPLVEDSFRVTIIELICACIKDQTSMIAAFFNISPIGENPDTSITAFMRGFLEAMQEDPNLLANPLHAGILELFHGLWKMNKQHVIKRLIEEDNFWMGLISPLFKTAGVKIEVLLLILEILILDMYSHKGEISEPFSKAIAKIFDESNKFINIWMNRLIAMTYKHIESDKGEVPVMNAFLTIWKKFIMAIRHFYPQYFDENWNKPMLESKCLQALLLYTNKRSEIPIMTLWAELCLTFSSTPLVRDDMEEEEIFECMVNILVNFSQFYEVVSKRCKSTLLTIACIVLRNCEKHIIRNPMQAIPFLLPFDRIFDLEYKNLLSAWTNEKNRRREEFYYNWVLILRIINTFIRLNIGGYCEYFFIDIAYLERISDVLEIFIKRSLPVRISEVMTMSCIDYAESELVKHFDKMYRYITGSIVLPNKYYLKENQLHIGVLPQHLKDWWTIFSYIMRCSGVLLHKRKGYIIKDILSFVITQHLVIIDGLSSATMIAEPSNLRMVIDILRFLYDVLQYMNLWTLEDGSSFLAVMITVKEVLNTAIGVILRPKVLVFVPVNRDATTIVRDTEVPEENLVNITDSFIEIIAWACLCFSRCNPPFIKLFDMFRPTNFKTLVEHDFRVPPVVNVNPTTLTYGSLLCALHFICKTLGQISLHEKEKAAPELSIVTPKTITADDPLLIRGNISKFPSFNVFIYPSYTKETPETISALHRFTIPETMGLQSWLIRLDSNNLLFSLNALNTFLAGQAFLTIHDTRVERSVMRYIRRELCSELLFFYDFVSKRILERNFVSTPVSPGLSEARLIATPRKSKSSIKIPSSETFRSTMEHDEGFFLNIDVSKICCDRASGKNAIVTSVDDCYLLVLAHWFRHVCRLVHYSKFDEFLSQWHAKSTCIMPDSTYVKNTNFRLSDDEEDE